MPIVFIWPPWFPCRGFPVLRPTNNYLPERFAPHYFTFLFRWWIPRYCPFPILSTSHTSLEGKFRHSKYSSGAAGQSCPYQCLLYSVELDSKKAMCQLLPTIQTYGRSQRNKLVNTWVCCHRGIPNKGKHRQHKQCQKRNCKQLNSDELKPLMISRH